MLRHALLHVSSLICVTVGISWAQATFDDRPLVNILGQRGIGSCYSAETFGIGRVALGISGNGTLDQGFLKKHEKFIVDRDTTKSRFVTDSTKPAVSTFNFSPFIGAGLTDFLDLSLMLPLHLDFLGQYQEFGIGDLQITCKIATHKAEKRSVFTLSFLEVLSAPTGGELSGVFPRHLYYFNKNTRATDSVTSVKTFFTSGYLDLESHVLMTLDLSVLKSNIPIVVHANGGIHIPTGPSQDKALLLNTAIEIRPIPSFALITGFNSEMRMYNTTHGFKLNKDYLHISPGIVISPESGFNLTLGSDISLAAPGATFAYEKVRGVARERITTGIEPKWRVFVGIGWNGFAIDLDRDRDGLYDNVDHCYKQAEDVDGFKDDDGCPDPDNDNDGFLDSLDKCPNEPEDKDGFKDDDGCPDVDNDDDHVPDSLDKCLSVREDFDAFQDGDGCPDYDNDADIVPDSLDRCPNDPEDIDGFQDNDGCPDIDNDLDGVADSVDKCQSLAGTPDNNGCPKTTIPEKPSTKEIKRGRVILRGVSFEKGSTAIDPNSYIILDEVVASLRDWPSIQIEIQGHTDNTGSETRNLDLSMARAEIVRNYLANRGIASVRLTIMGKGGSDPIADNATPQGRIMNNRIEIKRIDP